MSISPEFTPVSALAGGLLIGGATALLLLVSGRLAAVSSILGGLLVGAAGERGVRGAFLAGLLAGGLGLALARPGWFDALAPASLGQLALAGVLVGFGTRLGGGCTSGHGVCGLGRLSPRSLVAVLAFMATGAAAVFVTRHLLAGAAA